MQRRRSGGRPETYLDMKLREDDTEGRGDGESPPLKGKVQQPISLFACLLIVLLVVLIFSGICEL